MSDRTRRWLTWAVVAIIAAIVCTFLGRWQFSRHETKSEAIALVEANYEAQPHSLDEVVPDGVFDPTMEWTPVQITGSYVGDPVILPQRGVPGQAGDHVLSLFVTAEKEPQTFIIDRGWYPVGSPPASLKPPNEEITLTARVRPTEDASPRGVREGQVFAIDPAQVIEAQSASQTPNVQAGIYLVAAAEEPGQEGLNPFPRPPADLGNHLSYAFQWWIFAVGAFVGLGVVIRRDLKSHDPSPPKKRPVSVDAAEEDALIDAQLGNGHTI